jgi:H+-translocating NAD(P) transhydrogenase subunit alpha
MISPDDILINLLIFLISSFLGLELIRHVSRLLHTPLMSLTNAISSVAVVAALIVMSHAKNDFIMFLSVIAIGCAAINAFGGFMITERILKMFKKVDKK